VHRRLSSEPRALQSAEQALRPGRPRWLVGCASRPSARTEQVARRLSRAKRFGAVPRPQQVVHALYAWAELGFGLEVV
jgi:hypothetical protein